MAEVTHEPRLGGVVGGGKTRRINARCSCGWLGRVCRGRHAERDALKHFATHLKQVEVRMLRKTGLDCFNAEPTEPTCEL